MSPASDGFDGSSGARQEVVPPVHRSAKDHKRWAHAAYNFVPLPERLWLPDSPPFAAHDRLDPARLHGWIDVQILTETKLYTRAAYPESEEGRNPRESELRAAFFHHGDRPHIPVIPGSSVRGMVRSLVEILSYSRISRRPRGRAVRIHDHRLHHRSFTEPRDSPSRRAYEAALQQRRVEGGYLEFDARRHAWAIRRAVAVHGRSFVRVRDADLPPRFGDRTHERVSVRPLSGEDTAEVQHPDLAGRDGWVRAWLVLPGRAPRRSRHTAVFEPDPSPGATLRIPDAVWDAFEWDQELHRPIPARALPKPAAGGTPYPIFYTVERDADGTDVVATLGTTLHYRIPWECAPGDLLGADDELLGEDAALDVAERIFGTVNGATRPGFTHTGAHRGRVTFDDAICTSQDPFVSRESLVLGVLASPKPTSFQSYLVQPSGGGTPDALSAYQGGAGATALRGFKLYWNRPDPEVGGSSHRGLFRLRGPEAPLRSEVNESQLTRVRPVAAGKEFRGKIRFENLEPYELGCVLAALELPEPCRHRIGMGKPLGMGRVRIQCAVQLVDARARYARLDAGAEVDPLRSAELLANARAEFRTAVLDHHRRCWTGDDTPAGPLEDIWDVPRLGELRCLLDATPVPDPSLIEPPVGLDSASRDRKPLPTPSAVRGRPDPLIQGPAPVRVRVGTGHDTDRRPGASQSRATTGRPARPGDRWSGHDSRGDRARISDGAARSDAVPAEPLGPRDEFDATIVEVRGGGASVLLRSDVGKSLPAPLDRDVFAATDWGDVPAQRAKRGVRVRVVRHGAVVTSVRPIGDRA